MRRSERGTRGGALRRLLAVPVLMALIWPLAAPTAAFAAPVLSITPITWNVIGLDSNDVTDGPNVFPVGARVCNTGDATATNLNATFTWDSANALVNVSGATSLTRTQLAAGSCSDFNFDIAITRNAAAYDTARRYHITVTADAIASVTTPQPREVYVEHLVSQARNDIASITGPTTVYVGGTYDYTLVADTATNGYEQLENFITFPNIVFRIDAVATTYSAPVGGTNNKIYADACGWDNDPTSGTYMECVGPLGFPGGKAGGDITTVFTVTILSAGSANLTALIYDFSGSSFHYNGDYGLDVLAVTALDSADLSITKTDTLDPVLAGEEVTYVLSVANAGPTNATSVSVSDTLPAGTTFVAASGVGWTCVHNSGTVTCTRPALADGVTAPDITVRVTAPSSGGSITNTATVSSSTQDPSGGNDSDSESTTITPVADLGVSTTDSPDPVTAGSDVDYTLTVTNHGVSNATNVSVTDTIPAGTTFVSATGTGWTCNQAAGTVTCTRPALAAGASAPDITIVVTAPGTPGTITNNASVSATQTDSDPTNNSDAEDTDVQAGPPPSADLAMTSSDSPDPVDEGTDVDYTLTVTNNGPSGASNVTVTDTIPAGTTFVGASGTGWTCLEAAGTVTCTRPALASGATAPDITITVTAPSGPATITNDAAVSADQADPVPGNNSDSEDTDVVVPPPPPPPNNPPVAVDDSATTPEGDPVAISVTANDTDIDGNLDPSTVTVTSGPANGSVVCDAVGVCTYTPAPGFDGPDSFDYQVCDTDGDCDTATVSITVTLSADLTLTSTDSPDPVDEGTDVDYSLTVTNNGPSDASNVTVTDTIPTGTTFVSATGTGWTCLEAAGIVTCTRPALASGATAPDITITVTAPSGPATITNDAAVTADEADPVPGNNSDSEDTDVVVPPPPNNPPVAVDDTAGTTQDTPVAISVAANDTDIDGNLDPSTVQVTGGPANGTVGCDPSGVCTYTPNAGYSGPDSFDYQVCDTDGDCDTATVSITVTAAPPPPNNPPVAGDDTAVTAQDTPVAIGVTANDTDIDGNLDPSTVQVMSGPANGTVLCDPTGVCTYTPNAGYSGPDSFDYQVCDTDGDCDTATVSITVTALPPPPPVNNPPVAIDDSATTAAATAVPIGVSANDSDIDGNLDPSTVQVTSGPTNGSVSCAANGVCTYTPNAGFSGSDGFDYQICDTGGLCDTGHVSVTVMPPPNNPPVAVDDVATTAAGAPVAIGVSANDSDPDGNLAPSSVRVTNGPAHGTVSCAANGVCTYTPNPGFSGTDGFDYEICDTDGACDTGHVSITVTPPAAVPDPGPTPAPEETPGPGPDVLAVDDEAETVPGTAIVIEVVINDTASAGERIRLTDNTPAHGGSVTCNHSGVCTYSPDGFTGKDVFDYTICIETDMCDSATVTVRVRAPAQVSGGVLAPPAEAIFETLPFTGQPIAAMLIFMGFLLGTGALLIQLSRLRMREVADPPPAVRRGVRGVADTWAFPPR